MARSDAVWGIDLGNSSLKALRCRPGSQDGTVEALAFDFIEYPKILTQTRRGTGRIDCGGLEAVLVAGTISAGTRWPYRFPDRTGWPASSSCRRWRRRRYRDIVNYEAKQQIPFDLDDVIWDYQKMRGGSEEEGFALETEVGLFAMKRDRYTARWSRFYRWRLKSISCS